MARNDVPINVLLDRTMQQLEHAEAEAASLRGLLVRCGMVLANLHNLFPEDIDYLDSELLGELAAAIEEGEDAA
jgi:hypothetical protein